MGAYMVTRKHIDTLVAAAIEIAHDRDQPLRYDATPHLRITVFPTEADRIGRMLWSMNLDTVVAYYGETDEVETYRAEVESYQYHEPASLVDCSIGSLLKGLDSYASHACGSRIWEHSEARHFCDALRQGLIEQLSEYQDAAWLIDDYVEEPQTLRVVK